MKKVLTFCLLLLVISAHAQKSRDFSSKRRKDYFGGPEDFRDITKFGLQISFGVNYMVPQTANGQFSGIDAELNRPYDATIEPSGKIGGFIDIGMAHYRFKSSKLLNAWYDARGKSVKFIGGNLFHRVDWGLGFDYLGGSELTKVNYPLFNITNQSSGSFYNGYVYGRFTADRFTQLSERWHLETGIGFNFNYLVMEGSKTLSNGVIDTARQQFQQPFMLQFHSHLGFNYKIRRGDYLIFATYLPHLGLVESNQLKPRIYWYSSSYWPAHFQIKWIHHFTKKSNGCNKGSEEDRKKNEQYQQSR